MIKKYNTLSNNELRVIEEILLNPKFELSLLIKDGRTGSTDQTTFKSRFKRLFQSKNILGRVFFNIQVLIERKFFFKEEFTVDRDSIINELNKIDVIELKPQRKGFLDIFTDTDVEEVEKYKLDVLIRNEFNIIRGSILNSAKYGIWSFHHADNSINRGGPAGLWEIILNQSTVGATLQQLTPELDGGLVIDKAFFNCHWSFVKNNKLVKEASVSLLLKNLRKLEEGNYTVEKSTVYYNPLYKVPTLSYMLKYIFSFYYHLIKKAIERFNNKIFGIRYNCWTIFIGKGDFLNATLFRLKPVEIPKNEFWADPFICSYEEKDYVFFENYSYKTKKAKISCGLIDGSELIDITDVLELDYHMSYPYIFREDNEIFLMPETNDNNRLEIYKCIEFPNKWELFSTAFEGERVSDAFFYDDVDKQKWLFINKETNKYSTGDNELYIYKVDSIKLNKIEGHKENPVIIDSRTARNAGCIFDYECEDYRPSQANIDGIYGRALNINKIKKLNIDE
ncbi:MAG TPA: hypothetical protein ENK91_09055, partial [Bacteroidetes bacterium]|nr:hypothetical protein [Bacteroidota bacterium]